MCRLQNRYRIKRAKGAADNSLWNISSATEIVRKRALRASRLTLPIEIAELNRTVGEYEFYFQSIMFILPSLVGRFVRVSVMYSFNGRLLQAI